MPISHVSLNPAPLVQPAAADGVSRQQVPTLRHRIAYFL